MKKVLIVAYYFPPLGWSGVQRTLKFVKYLKNFEWEPVVATVGKTKFSVLDESLLDEVPKDVETIRIDDIKFKDITDEMKEKMMEYTKYSFNLILDEKLKDEYEKEIESTFERLRNLFLLPDGNAIWANNVIKEISNKINLDDISLVYSTSGPYSTHLIGYYLKKNYNLPWVTDFRDEWTNNPYYFLNKDLRYKIERELEKNFLINCDSIITISHIAKNNYINDFNINEHKIKIITNGYDENDFKCLKNKIENNKFKIVSNGSFYLGRNPYTFLKAIENILSNKLIKRENLNIEFIGTIEDAIKYNIEKMDLGDSVKFKGYLPHVDSLNKSDDANLLLLVIGQDESVKSVYTGKVFEYLRLKKPILALSPKGSVVEKLLNETGCGINVEYDDIEGIENTILKFYNDWINNKSFVVNEDKIKEYERKRLTQKLSNIFNELTK